MNIERRYIYSKDGNLLAYWDLPENTSEDVWQQSMPHSFATPVTIDKDTGEVLEEIKIDPDTLFVEKELLEIDIDKKAPDFNIEKLYVAV